MNKYLKKLVMVVLLLTVFLSCSATSAYADEDEILEYRFSFVDDNSTGEYGVSESPQQVEVLNSAFVRQNYASAPTLYVLCLENSSGTGPSISSWATEVIGDVTTGGTYPFTYKAGYGGYRVDFYLVGMPRAMEFDNYTVSGDWNA